MRQDSSEWRRRRGRLVDAFRLSLGVDGIVLIASAPTNAFRVERTSTYCPHRSRACSGGSHVYAQKEARSLFLARLPIDAELIEAEERSRKN